MTHDDDDEPEYKDPEITPEYIHGRFAKEYNGGRPLPDRLVEVLCKLSYQDINTLDNDFGYMMREFGRDQERRGPESPYY